MEKWGLSLLPPLSGDPAFLIGLLSLLRSNVFLGGVEELEDDVESSQAGAGVLEQGGKPTGADAARTLLAVVGGDVARPSGCAAEAGSRRGVRC